MATTCQAHYQYLRTCAPRNQCQNQYNSGQNLPLIFFHAKSGSEIVKWHYPIFQKFSRAVDRHQKLGHTGVPMAQLQMLWSFIQQQGANYYINTHKTVKKYKNTELTFLPTVQLQMTFTNFATKYFFRENWAATNILSSWPYDWSPNNAKLAVFSHFRQLFQPQENIQNPERVCT